MVQELAAALLLLLVLVSAGPARPAADTDCTCPGSTGSIVAPGDPGNPCPCVGGAFFTSLHSGSCFPFEDLCIIDYADPCSVMVTRAFTPMDPGDPVQAAACKQLPPIELYTRCGAAPSDHRFTCASAIYEAILYCTLCQNPI